MRRTIRWAARLYPRNWRERYGEEFDALLEEAGAGPMELMDVLGGAVKMQLGRGNYVKFGAVAAVLGAVVAAAISWSGPERFVSTAVVRVAAQPDGARGREVAAEAFPEVLSDSILAGIVQQRSLDLYPEERRRIPMEDVLTRMRRDIRVREEGRALVVSFAYPDRAKAQATLLALMSEFLKRTSEKSRLRAEAWHEVWPQAAPPAMVTIDVAGDASLPVKPLSPNRLAYVVAGLGVGLGLGLLAALAMRRPGWVLRMAGGAAAGCALGAGVSFLMPTDYRSTAVLRIAPPIVTETPDGRVEASSVYERLRPLQEQVLSAGKLEETIAKCGLYPGERGKAGFDAVATLRNHLAVDVLGATNQPAAGSALVISFTYRDRYRAQAVVREIIHGFFERNAAMARERTKNLAETDPVRKIAERRLGSNLVVLDAASLPESPLFPNRVAVAGAGLVAGLVLGGLTLLLGHPREVGRRCAT